MDKAEVRKVTRSTRPQVFAEARPRRGLMVYNNSDADILILFGEGNASAQDFSTVIRSGTSLGPAGMSYDGRISGIWMTKGEGTAHITELHRVND